MTDKIPIGPKNIAIYHRVLSSEEINIIFNGGVIDCGCDLCKLIEKNK